MVQLEAQQTSADLLKDVDVILSNIDSKKVEFHDSSLLIDEDLKLDSQGDSSAIEPRTWIVDATESVDEDPLLKESEKIINSIINNPNSYEYEAGSIMKLTPPLAKKLVEWVNKMNRKSLDLEKLIEIDVETASELAKFNWNYLGFWTSFVLDSETLFPKSFRSINADIARELAKFKWNELNLSCLKNITEDIARELAEFKCSEWGYLNLGWLSDIDKNIARELAIFNNWNWGRLWLTWLRSIDKDIARELSNFKWLELFIRVNSNDIKLVSEELSMCNSRYLHINWLRSIDKNSARNLSNFKWESLILNGLNVQDPDILHEFEQYKWELRFSFW